jgi:hypothetical protein
LRGQSPRPERTIELSAVNFEVLVERDRRALRVHLGADVAAHLSTLQTAFLAALRS